MTDATLHQQLSEATKRAEDAERLVQDAVDERDGALGNAESWRRAALNLEQKFTAETALLAASQQATADLRAQLDGALASNERIRKEATLFRAENIATIEARGARRALEALRESLAGFYPPWSNAIAKAIDAELAKLEAQAAPGKVEP